MQYTDRNKWSRKSTILDAISSALGGYLSGFDNIKGRYIQPDDVHVKMFPVGNRIEPQEQFPVEIYAQASVKVRDDTHIIGWQRELNRQRGYEDCTAAESNEKQMMQWFEEMTYIQLQEEKPIEELEAVKAVLRQCYLSADHSIKDAKFYYNVKNHELEVNIIRETEEEKFPVRMLSDGEKGIISMTADIAYRMAMLNPNLLDHVLETPGIIMIDEIDLHLHPAWQKKIVQDFMNIFPNVQFIMTTHSANILVNVPREHIWLLNHFQLFQPQDKTYGRTVEEILREVMDVNVRPDEILDLQQRFNHAIDKMDFVQANEILKEMKKIVGENAAEVIEDQIVLDVESE